MTSGFTCVNFLFYSLPFSPFEVKVGTECGHQKVRAWGPGLEGGVVGKSADFVVEAIGDDVGTLGESLSQVGKVDCILLRPIISTL